MIRIGDFQFGPDERAAIQRVVDSERVSEWRETRAFEEEFAAWLGVKHCVAVSSGTAALMVGLKTLEYLRMIPPQAHVLIPALTFIANANAVKLCGMEPVFADIDMHTYTMEPDFIAFSDVDVVIPVHLFGFGAAMTEINANLRYKPRFTVLCEDACEAHGTTINGHLAGTQATWGAFSFYIAHTVQAGELGAIVTDNADIARVARQVKAHGRMCTCKVCTRSTTGCHKLADGDPRFLAQFAGYNFKTTEWSTALARVQLAKVDENIATRRENAATLTKLLSHDKLILPAFRAGDVPMVYPMILKDGNRNAFLADLEKHGIEARPSFGCIPLQQPAYREYQSLYCKTLPVAEHVGEHGFYVGCHQYLTKRELHEMATTILERLENV